MTVDYDRLNNIESITWKRKSMPYDRYFGEMPLTDTQKKERIEYAEEFEDILIAVMYLWLSQYVYGMVNTEYIRDTLAADYAVILDKIYRDSIDPYQAQTGDYSTKEDFIADKSRTFSDEFVRVTQENEDDPYYLSLDRAMYIAENESNGNENYKDLLEAIENGYKYKEWVSMRDKHVRRTHNAVDGETIPIRAFFNVGHSQMLYPHDEQHGAEAKELINCRCVCKYK